ncbi:hypothetical protein HMPREF1868_00094 [Olsenella sp. DNF00959]|nr:hypothetical protein HMPREF1868_00094 [Olsenella sp. DNF00959]
MSGNKRMSHVDDGKNMTSQVLPIIKGLLVLLAIVLIVVCGIAVLISLAAPGVTAFFSSLSALDSAIVVALITATVSVITYVSGSIANSIMKRNEYLRMHREKPYMQLISMFYDFQTQTKTGKEFTQEELINLFNQFTKELTLWGSSKAIKVWGNWRVASSRGLATPMICCSEWKKS